MDQESAVLASATPVASTLFHAHENRLQNLEDLARGNASTLSVHGHRLDELGTKIDSSVMAIGARMDEALEPVVKALGDLTTSVNSSASRVEALEKSEAERVAAKAEASERKKANGVRFAALIWSLVGVALTVFVKDGIPAIIKFLG